MNLKQESTGSRIPSQTKQNGKSEAEKEGRKGRLINTHECRSGEKANNGPGEQRLKKIAASDLVGVAQWLSAGL